MSRTVPFDPNKICDLCGRPGSYDFMGDFICQDCYDASSSKCEKCGADAEIQVGWGQFCGPCYEALPGHDGCGNDCDLDCPGDDAK